MARWSAVFVLVGGLGLALVGLRARLRPQRTQGAAGSAETLTSRPRERPSTPEGLGVWIVDDSTKVFPGDELSDSQRAPAALPVKLEGARNETVSFQIVLAAREGSSRVEVGATDLAGGSASIPRNHLTVFREYTLDCPPVKPKAVSLGPGEYPDALVPLFENGWGTRPIASPFSLEPRRNRILWVDLEIPRTASADRFSGSLELRAEGFAAMEIPIELTVLPFEIPATTHLSAWVPLYQSRLWKREKLRSLGRAGAVTTIQRYFRMAHRHRFVTQIMEEQPRLKWDESSGALLHSDWSRYDALNGSTLDGSLFEDHEPPAVWKVGGFIWWGARHGIHPNFGGSYKTDSDLTPAHKRALAEYAREVSRHFHERGWTKPQLFMYMIDEPDYKRHPNLLRLIKGYGDAIHSAGTGIRHLVTMGPGDSPITLGAVDIWTRWGAGYYPRLMQARQKLGDKAWFYQQHEPFVGGNCVNNEGLGLRSWAWIAWRYRVDGIFLWVGDYWTKDPYHDALNWNKLLPGNGVLFYPGALLPSLGLPEMHGPVSSFRMKSLRRGLLDYEYFYLLRSLGGDPDPLVSRVVHHALNEQEIKPYWNHPLWAKHGDWSHDPADWDRARREAAQEIVRRLGH